MGHAHITIADDISLLYACKLVARLNEALDGLFLQNTTTA